MEYISSVRHIRRALPSGAEEAIQEIADSKKKCTGNILELSITK
jgi:hypothetical protein